jgi:hypothetical protein
MIGALFCISLIVYAVMTRRKRVVVTSAFAAGLFSILLIASYPVAPSAVGGVEVSSEKTSEFYNPQNLMILFATVNGLLVVPAAVGFLRMKNSLLKIPLLAALAGSFSWIAIPDISLLVADRWVVLAGIFLSIFAGYGIVQTVKGLKLRHSTLASCSILAAFAVIGLGYAVMSYENPFPLYGAARSSTQDFGPVTMQFNSLDIEDNDKLISTIQWINQNTESNAIIVGEKHWRGFMEMQLEDGRTYRFSGNPEALAEALERQGAQVYEITFDGSSQKMFEVEDVAIR